MNKSIIAACAAGLVASACVTQCAHAESFFSVDVALAKAHTKDMGDGTWIQEGAPLNSETVNAPAVIVGISVPMWSSGNVDVKAHLDYTYIGTLKASVDGVPDQYYDPTHHKVLPSFAATGDRFSPFNGQGHVQGVSFTLDAGYSWNGYRFGVEAGPWVYWQTWHESLYGLEGDWHNLSHKTVPQLGYVVGASVTQGHLSLGVRYYSTKQRWNPYPGLSQGTVAVFGRYSF